MGCVLIFVVALGLGLLLSWVGLWGLIGLGWLVFSGTVYFLWRAYPVLNTGQGRGLFEYILAFYAVSMGGMCLGYFGLGWLF